MKDFLSLIASIPSRIAMLLIKVYRLGISPVLGPNCRFTPTCSQYSLTAFKRFGFFRGLYLTVRRIMRCRPGGGTGYDPVPEEFSFRIG
jgi:putative membrane protein insertion efficiency factor